MVGCLVIQYLKSGAAKKSHGDDRYFECRVYWCVNNSIGNRRKGLNLLFVFPKTPPPPQITLSAANLPSTTTMMRPCIQLAAKKAIHWRANHAAVISHNRPVQLSIGRGGVGSSGVIDIISLSSVKNQQQLNNIANRSLTTTKPPSITNSNAPKTVVDERQQAIEKAEQLHKELNDLLKAQETRRQEESNRPFGSGLIQFFKSSKSEMFNIFFAFICVLLAYQIHKMRTGIKKLLDEQDMKRKEIDQLRGLLATLSKEEDSATDSNGEETTPHNNNNNNIFSMTLAEKCAEVVRRMFENSEKKAGYGWILGRKLATRDSLESDNLIDELQSVILTEIHSVIGDAAYTPEELKERRVAALKGEDVAKNRSACGSSGGNGRRDNAQLGGLLEIFEEVQKNDLSDGGRDGSSEGDSGSNNMDSSTPGKVRRTRYAI